MKLQAVGGPWSAWHTWRTDPVWRRSDSAADSHLEAQRQRQVARTCFERDLYTSLFHGPKPLHIRGFKANIRVRSGPHRGMMGADFKSPDQRSPAMPINFLPKRGQILMCDYTKKFIEPEMQKVRHCVVVSPERRTGSCLVVPLSTVPPQNVQLYHYKIPRGVYPCLECGTDVWVKGDMLTHASFARLDRPKENGRFASVHLRTVHLEAVVNAVLAAIGYPVKAATPMSNPGAKVDVIENKDDSKTHGK